MSSRHSDPFVDLDLGASPVLAALSGAAGLLAVVAVLLSGLYWPVKLGMILAIPGIGGYWMAGKLLRLMPRSTVRLVLMPERECILIDRGGRARTLRIDGGLALVGRLVVLTLRGEGRFRETVCVSADAVRSGSLRRLCVQIRLMPVRPDSSPKEMLHGRRG